MRHSSLFIPERSPKPDVLQAVAQAAHSLLAPSLSAIEGLLQRDPLRITKTQAKAIHLISYCFDRILIKSRAFLRQGTLHGKPVTNAKDMTDHVPANIDRDSSINQSNVRRTSIEHHSNTDRIFNNIYRTSYAPRSSIDRRCYRTSIEHLSEIYRTSIENLSMP